MNTKRKKALQANVLAAIRALGLILLHDGHDLSQLLYFPTQNAEALHINCANALCGLAVLEALLNYEIVSDNVRGGSE